MDNDTINNQKIASVKSVKKSHWKIYFYLLVVIIILGAAAYGYYLYRHNQTLQVQLTAQTAKISSLDQSINNHQKLIVDINQEKTRCESFINQGEGEFDEFEYCKKIVEWIDGLGL